MVHETKKTGQFSLLKHRTWVAFYGGWEPRWRRPDHEVADRVLLRLAQAFGEPAAEIVGRIVPRAQYTPAERGAVEATVRQAIAIVVLTARRVARNGQPLSTNALFDAVARCWSPEYGRVTETTPAQQANEMTPGTIKRARHDILYAGIRLNKLFELARRDVRGWYRVISTAKGWRVRPVRKPKRTERLMLADDKPPARRLLDPYTVLNGQHVTAEVGYGPVLSRERSLAVMRALEETRLFLNARKAREELTRLEVKLDDAHAAFDAVRQPHKRVKTTITTKRGTKEVDGWDTKWRQEEIAALTALREARGPVLALRPIVAALPADGQVMVRTRIKQAINRRWHATTYWPEHISGKDEQVETFPPTYYEDGELNEGELSRRTVARGRVFSAARFGGRAPSGGRWVSSNVLAGADVSSSQWQILSILAADTHLEAQLQKRSAHEIAARKVWPSDPSGPERAKSILVPGGYGSKPHRIVQNLSLIDEGTGVPKAEVQRVLTTVGYGTGGRIKRLADYCRRVAGAVDAYLGFRFTDPFDGSEVIWHPIRTEREIVSSDVVKLTTFVPKEIAWPWWPGVQNPEGRAPVDRRKLQQQIAPMLVHALDSAFSGHVIEGLRARGAQNVVALFDCWLVEEQDVKKLNEAVEAAGEPWLRSLGTIYDALLAYDLEDRAWIEKLKTHWQERVTNRRWPKFRTKPVTLATWEKPRKAEIRTR